MTGKCHPYRPNYVGPVYGRDCCVSFNTIKSVLIPTYRRLLPRKPCPLGYRTFEGTEAVWPGLRGGSWDTAWSELDKILFLDEKDGGFIEFKSYEQGREAYQGPQRHWIRHDEEPPESIYGENLARQLTLKRNIIFTLTPLNYSQWLYNRIYEGALTDDKINCIMMSGSDNPYISETVLSAIEAGLSDPAERAARLHGEFTFLSGRVYKDYGEHNLKEWFRVPDQWHKSIIIDPHLDKPTAVNMMAQDFQGRYWGIAEGDFEGDVKHICDQINAMCSGHRIDLWLIDPSSRFRSLVHGKGRLIDEFRKYLPWLIEANNDRDLGIDAVRKAVKNGPNGPNLFTMSNCPVTHHQMKNYSWKPPLKSGESRGKPEVVKKSDDHPDNYRYRLVHGDVVTHSQFNGFGVGVYANA